MILPIFTSCEKEENEKYYISLEKNAITIDNSGGSETIKLTANNEWNVQDIPDWITISPTYGDSSAVVYIQVESSEEEMSRNETLTFTCGNSEFVLAVKQNGLKESGPVLRLSGDLSTLSLTGEMRVIKLTANRPWEITNIPSWLNIYPISGDESAEITIIGRENRDVTGRSTQLRVTSEDINEFITINQVGLRDVLTLPLLPIFSFKEMKFSTTYNHFEMHLYSLFINPGIKDKIYLGNLVSHNANPHTDIPVFKGYTFNPITILTTSNIEGTITRTFIPSLADQDAFAKEIIAQLPTQDETNMYDKGDIEFYDYRRLHTLGIANMGIKLDEIVSGASFKEKEMSKKYGMIFSFKDKLFTLLMDLPQPNPLLKEELKQTDKAKGVSYVSAVSYGKIGLLVVESDTDLREFKAAVTKVIEDAPLSQQEIRLIEEADISFVYFNENTEVQIKKGKMDVILAYKEAIRERTKDVHPLEFQLTDFYDHSVNTISFDFDIPE